MKVCFQADNDFNQKIVRAVWEIAPDVDFQTATEANLDGSDDLTVLELAALEKRLLVSSDQSTMPLYFAKFIPKQTNYGLLIAPQSLGFETVVEEMMMIWLASEAEEWIDRIAYLPL